MKTQEAIKKLIALKNFGIHLLDGCVVDKEKMWKSVQEALSMAIEALKNCSTDCISRQEAIDAYGDLYVEEGTCGTR